MRLRALAGAALLLAGSVTELEAQKKPFAREGVMGRLERAAVAREQAAARSTYDPIFRKYSKRYFGPAFDWRHFKAQAMAESDLIPTARSRVGARGLMQLMPGTFNLIFDPKKLPRPIEDPEWNIAAGVMHDRYLWTRWKKEIAEPDQMHFMFASYNAGEGPIIRARRTALQRALDATRWGSIEQVAPQVDRWRYTETLGYVRRISENYRALRSAPVGR